MLENYEKLNDGHWHQIERTGEGPMYSIEYSNYYNKIPSKEMSKLRYDIIKKYVKEFSSICDFGYGNGDFISYCNSLGHNTFAYDISDYPCPEGTKRIYDISQHSFDIISFFDAIEHIPDSDLINFLKGLDTKNVIISVPWFHESLGKEWFINWKHRKENEHFHHFDSAGLINLLIQSNFKILHLGNDEDVIRKPVDNYPNILTIFASKL